jgi:hypothetical protein
VIYRPTSTVYHNESTGSTNNSLFGKAESGGPSRNPDTWIERNGLWFIRMKCIKVPWIITKLKYQRLGLCMQEDTQRF